MPAKARSTAAIAQRIRAVVGDHSPATLDVMADLLGVSPTALRRLIMERERPIDAAFLTDMVSALAREFGTDPAWLLTGEYDAELHQHALVLSEDRSPAGVRALRDFIRDEYSRFLESETIRLPPARPADHGRRSRGSGSE